MRKGLVEAACCWTSGRAQWILAALGAFALAACADREAQPKVAENGGQGGSSPMVSTATDAGGAMGSGGTMASVPMGAALTGAPMVYSPTADGFGISVALASGDPGSLSAQVRKVGADDWGEMLVPEVRATDLAQWRVEDLAQTTEYEYRIVATDDEGEQTTLFEGVQVTQRAPGESFRFALLTDSHIGANLDYTNQGDPSVLSAVSAEIAEVTPDFVVNLGDMLDFHEFGFNVAPPDTSITRQAYLNYRELLGETVGKAAHFGVIGNWEGENGNYTEEEIERSRNARLLYLPGPNPDTYPEGGSPVEDYYAFTWGDALFVVLNVMTYTPTEHLLSSVGGQADDWTLGQEQFDWLRQTLENAESKWRFLLIHHAVGGAAGDVANANYGRGGGQAAYVGEQALVHQLMLDYGVQIFFYGHDHVFTDMVVDDIHYSMPGSAGAIWMFGPEETGYEESWLTSGWAQVDVTTDSVHVQFIEKGGEPIYEYMLE